MEHFVGGAHLSPEHILARHEDDAYKPPHYPHSWDERKWIKEEGKNQKAKKVFKEEESRIREYALKKTVLILSGVSHKMQMEFHGKVQELIGVLKEISIKKERRQAQLEEQKILMRVVVLKRNSKGGQMAGLLRLFQELSLSEIDEGPLVLYAYLMHCSIGNLSKKDRNFAEGIVKIINSELQRRQISTQISNIIRLYQALPREVLQEFSHSVQIAQRLR